MRRLFIFLTLFCCLAIAAVAVIRHSPFAHSRLAFLWSSESRTHPDVIPESFRQTKYYNRILRVQADSLCVVKHRRELYVFQHDTLVKIYRVALGDAPSGHKRFEG